MDLGTQFCERCGRDRDSFASARNTYRDCPSCGAACCADCWNLVDGACLACAPFRLAGTTTRPRIVVAPTPAVGMSGTADPYADLRGGGEPVPDAWSASWGTARHRRKESAPAGASPATPAPDAWRAGHIDLAAIAAWALAATAAWAVTATLVMVALGA